MTRRQTGHRNQGDMRAVANRSRSLRDELRSVFGRAKVPTNPAIAVQILRLADDPNSDAEQFAEVIQADAALAARLLEMANAACLAQREPASTIQRAVTVLGLRHIRMVALGFQLVAHLDRLGDCPFDLKTFWQHSLLRACLAREIAAKVVPAHADEAFVVGLLQDCGIPLLVQVLGTGYADLYASANLSPTAFYMEEQQQFAHNHVEAIQTMASEWKLPEVIGEPLGQHHCRVPLGPQATPLERLSAVSYFVGSLPLVGEQTPAPSEPELQEYSETELALNEAALNDCLCGAGQAYREVAPLLAEQLPDDVDVTVLLDQANHHLSRAASEAVGHAKVVEAQRDEICRQQAHLKSALGQYRERAARDPLTRLLNRGALVDATLASIRECCDKDVPLSVFFLDLDDFKVVNDKFGHHVGDEVLRALAGILGESVINGGFAGRYGGEEFIVVVPTLDEEAARQRAQALVDRVRHTRFSDSCPARSVTCSVGAVWGRPKPGMSPRDLFATADALMYQAKFGGKNRCCFKSFEPLNTTLALVPTGETDEPADPAIGHEHVGEDQAHTTPEDFRRLAAEMNRTRTMRFENMRKRERQGLLTPCVVRCFVSDSPALQSSPGYVRNISTGGLGVLTTRPMIRGEPVEVALLQESDDNALLHVAGLVAFCRHVEGGICEVGIQLLAQAKGPIFSRDPSSATQRFDWVVSALRATHGQDEPLKESA